MAKVKLYLGIGYANADRKEIIEVPDEDLEGLTEEGKYNYLDELAKDWMWEFVELSAKIIEEK